MSAEEHRLLPFAKCSCGAEHDRRGTGESGHDWFARHVAATPDAGDASEVEVLAWDDAFKRAINQSIYDFRMGRRSNDGIAHDVARAVLASDWLAAREAAARAEERDAARELYADLHEDWQQQIVRAEAAEEALREARLEARDQAARGDS